MNTRGLLCFALACFAISGCDGDDDERGDGGDPSACGGGTRCGVDPCADAGVEAVEWSEPVDIGGSAELAFAAVEGSCEAPFSWDGAPAEPNTVDPRSGQSTVTVAVELDHDSARVHRSEARSDGFRGCESALVVDGHASVRTADGVFEDEADVTLAYRERGGLQTFGFEVALEDAGGTLSVALGARDRGSLHYRMSGADEACAGEVYLGITSSDGRVGMASMGRLAQWSSSGCPIGESPVDPNEPGEGGEPSLADRIAELWGDAAYPGEWDDGEQTTLELSVEVPDTMACGSDGQAVIPVRATYGTADGRIESHTTDAYVNSGIDVTMALNIDETMQCADASDPLPYTLLGCDELESVQIQLFINYDGNEVESAEGLNAYETHRGGSTTGGADRLRTLLLSPD